MDVAAEASGLTEDEEHSNSRFPESFPGATYNNTLTIVNVKNEY